MKKPRREFTEWCADNIEDNLKKTENKQPWEIQSISSLVKKLNDNIAGLESVLSDFDAHFCLSEHVKQEAFSVMASAGMLAARFDREMMKLRRGRAI